MWFLPAALIVFTLIVAIPLSKYIAWIMEGKYRPWAFLSWIEKRADELEAVHRGVVNIQYRPVCLGIRRVIASAGDAAKRLTPGNAVPNHHL
jgi:hypothetical protein